MHFILFVSSLTSSESVRKCHVGMNHLLRFVQDYEYSVAEFILRSETDRRAVLTSENNPKIRSRDEKYVQRTEANKYHMSVFVGIKLRLDISRSVSHSGELRVHLRSGPSEEVVMLHTNSSGRSWTRFSQTVEMSKPFQVA